ncbi:MAG: hypothetical protein RQ826_09225, partial [Xanthomonadales bacterium]|nr:hypothetical protein [Xanthomonadales bacterium]
RLDTLGVFRRAGVCWLGASEVPRELVAFRALLAAALDGAEICFDQKEWKFHLTLYRGLRKPRPILHPVAIEWQLSGFDLIESVSTQSGVEYRSIGHWQAGRAGSHSGLA